MQKSLQFHKSGHARSANPTPKAPKPELPISDGKEDQWKSNALKHDQLYEMWKQWRHRNWPSNESSSRPKVTESVDQPKNDTPAIHKPHASAGAPANKCHWKATIYEQRSWMILNSVPLLLRTILCYPTIHFGSRRPNVRNNVSNKLAHALFFQNAFSSQKICQKECQKICQKECQKRHQGECQYVRKNVRRCATRYVRKNVKRYVRKNVKRYVKKNVRRYVKRWNRRMSKDMSERMSKDMSERMSKDMSERMLEGMSERMSEGMLERMSERQKKYVRKNVRRYVRKTVRRYVRKNVKRYVRETMSENM